MLNASGHLLKLQAGAPAMLAMSDAPERCSGVGHQMRKGTQENMSWLASTRVNNGAAGLVKTQVPSQALKWQRLTENYEIQ